MAMDEQNLVLAGLSNLHAWYIWRLATSRNNKRNIGRLPMKEKDFRTVTHKVMKIHLDSPQKSFRGSKVQCGAWRRLTNWYTWNWLKRCMFVDYNSQNPLASGSPSGLELLDFSDGHTAGGIWGTIVQKAIFPNFQLRQEIARWILANCSSSLVSSPKM